MAPKTGSDHPLSASTEQISRFKTAAHELGCDESEERFDAALGKVVKHKPKPDDKPAKSAKKAER